MKSVISELTKKTGRALACPLFMRVQSEILVETAAKNSVPSGMFRMVEESAY
jgi:hypothetical protein